MPIRDQRRGLRYSPIASVGAARPIVAVAVPVAIAAAVAVAAAGAGRVRRVDRRVATPLTSAPEPAVSPPARSPLPGTVLGLAGTPEGVAVDLSGTVAVNVRQPDGLVIFDLATPTVRRTVTLGGSARHLSLAGPDGPLLVPDESDDRLLEVALPSGDVLESIPVGRQPHDAVAAAGGTVFVGNELASTIDVIRDGVTIGIVLAPLQPGGVAASPDGSVVVVVGVRGRRITAYRPDGSIVGSANCGAGPTHVVTGDGGLVLGGRYQRRSDAGLPRRRRRAAPGRHHPGRLQAVRGRPTTVAARRCGSPSPGSDELVGLHLRGTVVTCA